METRKEEYLEAEAYVKIWNYLFGFSDMAVVRCAVDLNIPDILEKHVGTDPMTLSDLSSAVGCPPSTLHRIMRYLVNRRIFREEPCSISSSSSSDISKSKSKGYVPTPISRLLTKTDGKSLASLLLLETSPVMLAPWLGLSNRVLTDCGSHAFEAANGKDLWTYAKENADHSKLINDAMACDARLAVPALIRACPDLFHGVESVVDVGGGDGTALGLLLEAFPWIRGINFDLPHVVSVAKEFDRVENVGGDMFESIPMADAVFIMWVLHDWGDEECVKILKKCRESIPTDKGKVLIVEAVLAGEEEEEELEEGKNKLESDDLEYARLMLDMVMMAHTQTGKERTLKEWGDVIDKAGFSRFTVHRIQAVQSVIVAYA